MDNKHCFHCQTSEEHIPLVKLSFRNKELWICPRCIPSLIHEPQIVQSSLDRADQTE